MTDEWPEQYTVDCNLGVNIMSDNVFYDNYLAEVQPPRNIALLNQVMDHIDANPQAHNQGIWIGRNFESTGGPGGETRDCGTAACFAGWTCLLSTNTERVDQWAGVVMARGGALTVPEFARSELGLTHGESNWLFNGYRTREQLRATVDLWTEEAANGIERRAPVVFATEVQEIHPDRTHDEVAEGLQHVRSAPLDNTGVNLGEQWRVALGILDRLDAAPADEVETRELVNA